MKSMYVVLKEESSFYTPQLNHYYCYFTLVSVGEEGIEDETGDLIDKWVMYYKSNRGLYK